MARPTDHTGAAMAIGAAVAFSFKAIFVKFALRDGADPIVLLAMRMLIAAPFFAAFLAVNRSAWRHATRQDLGPLVVLGLLGFYAAAVLDFWGLAYLTAGLERIVLYAHPTFVLLFSAALTRTWPERRSLTAVAVAWTGLVIAAGADVSAAGNLPLGTALVLGSAVLYAAYLIGVQRIGARLGSLQVAAAANLVATVALAVHVLALHPGAFTAAPLSIWKTAAIMAVGSTVLPHLLLAAAITRIGPGPASTLGMVGPVAAALLGWALLGEPLSFVQLLGGAVVVAGVSMSR